MLKRKMCIRDRSVGYQQMVEISKALSKNVQLLIMDEPSAPLTNNEVDSMFEAVERLKAVSYTHLDVYKRQD